MLVFIEGGKPEYPEKNPRSKDENQQQTRPKYDTGTGNRTRATLVEGKCSHTAPSLLPRDAKVCHRVSFQSNKVCNRVLFLGLCAAFEALETIKSVIACHFKPIRMMCSWTNAENSKFNGLRAGSLFLASFFSPARFARRLLPPRYSHK